MHFNWSLKSDIIKPCVNFVIICWAKNSFLRRPIGQKVLFTFRRWTEKHQKLKRLNSKTDWYIDEQESKSKDNTLWNTTASVKKLIVNPLKKIWILVSLWIQMKPCQCHPPWHNFGSNPKSKPSEAFSDFAVAAWDSFQIIFSMWPS